jgi:hypothetical protein
MPIMGLSSPALAERDHTGAVVAPQHLSVAPTLAPS